MKRGALSLTSDTRTIIGILRRLFEERTVQETCGDQTSKKNEEPLIKNQLYKCKICTCRNSLVRVYNKSLPKDGSIIVVDFTSNIEHVTFQDVMETNLDCKDNL